MSIFSDINIEQFFQRRLELAKKRIDELDAESLSQKDDEYHIRRILEEVRITPLRLRFDEVKITKDWRDIPSEYHPRDRFFLSPEKSFSRLIIHYHLPFEGDPELLQCRPNPTVIIPVEINIQENEITFELIKWNGDELKSNAQKILSALKQILLNLTTQVNDFNSSAQTKVLQLFSIRKSEIKKDADFITNLGYPIKKETFSKAIERTISQREITFSHSSHRLESSESECDIFISHASEDKDDFVRPLAESLLCECLTVWYDEYTLVVGDSLREKIDDGLSKSRFGIVVLSHNFFAKEWPKKELDGLFARETSSAKVILPVWHGVEKEDVLKFSPILADRVAVRSNQGIQHVVNEILKAINRNNVK